MNKKRVLAIIAIVAIVTIMTACLCACNAESIAKKLEKKGYKVSVATEDEIKNINKNGGGLDGGLKWYVAGLKGTDVVHVYCFNKADDAKKMEEVCTEAKTYEKVKRVGKVVCFGAASAVDDAM